jgi:predicted transcriptional regulator
VSLAKSLGIPDKPAPRARCPVAVLKESLDNADREALYDTMLKIQTADVISRKVGQNPYTVAWLSTKLNENGYRINAKSIGRHINRRCSCDSL